VKVKAYDFGSGVKTIKVYIDNSLVKTTTGKDECTYYWDTTGYPDRSVHKVKVYAEDYAGNYRTRERSYIIGYKEITQNYKYPHGFTGEYARDLGIIAFTKIESDLFGLILQIEAHSILGESGEYYRVCYFDVTTMYYCKDIYRVDYNLDPADRPLTAPHGTLVELNFEMEETNTDLADYSCGEVESLTDDDQLFWPQFSSPDVVAATELTKKAISKLIDTLVGFLDLSKFAGFAIGKMTDHILDETFDASDDPFFTGLTGAEKVEIIYRNPTPSGQIVLYPENNFNFAYDGISRHRIEFNFKVDSAIAGQTLGLKFRCRAQYVDTRSDCIDEVVSEWVKIEFVLN